MQKTIIITGATGNLGSDVVAYFLENDYRIAAISRPGHSTEDKKNLRYFEADLTNEDDTKKCINNVIKEFGEINTALLLAGGFAMGNLENTSKKDLDKMFAINFETAFFTVKPVLNQMMLQEQGGKIVLMGAKAALETETGINSIAYALSKSLLFKLSDFINEEGKDKNIVSTVIAPSIINTSANRKAMPDADFSKWVNTQNLAEIMEFITSEKSDSLRNTVIKAYNNS